MIGTRCSGTLCRAPIQVPTLLNGAIIFMSTHVHHSTWGPNVKNGLSSEVSLYQYLTVAVVHSCGTSHLCGFPWWAGQATQLASGWLVLSPAAILTETCWTVEESTTWALNWNQHDDVIKWKHFPRYWPFVRGIQRSPVNSPHKGQWCGALTFSLICVWINCWVNNSEAGDLRRYRAHYDVTVMNKDIEIPYRGCPLFIVNAKTLSEVWYKIEIDSACKWLNIYSVLPWRSISSCVNIFIIVHDKIEIFFTMILQVKG